MVAVLTLEPIADPVQPGAAATTQITIRNAGAHVDMFTIEAVGPLAEYVAFSVPGVNLLPESEDVVVITISPPRATVPEAGNHPLAIRVTPQKNPTEPSAEEISVELLPFVQFSLDLAPKNSRGGRRGKHELAVENVGNRPATVELSGYDDKEGVTVELKPNSFDLYPGDLGFAVVEVVPKKRFLRGSDVAHQYRLLAASRETEPLFQPATYTQHQVLPKWFWKALAGAVLGLLLLAGLFFAARSNITSNAEQAAKEQTEDSLSASGVQPVDPDTGAPTGPTPGAPATPPPDEGEEPGDGEEPGEGSGLVASSSVAFRLDGNNGQRDVPANGRLSVSDILLSNPDGASGKVRILRGTELLFETELRNFRDLDQHFRVPLEFTTESPLIFEAPIGCGCSALFSGQEDVAE